MRCRCGADAGVGVGADPAVLPSARRSPAQIGTFRQLIVTSQCGPAPLRHSQWERAGPAPGRGRGSRGGAGSRGDAGDRGWGCSGSSVPRDEEAAEPPASSGEELGTPGNAGGKGWRPPGVLG